MDIKHIKQKYKIKDQDLAKWFGYKNRMSYYNAKKGKARIEEGLGKFYNHINNSSNLDIHKDIPKYEVGYKFLHKSTDEELKVISIHITNDVEKCLYKCSNGVYYSESEIEYHNYCHSR